ncbi:MAG: vitamin K epoxide reductase family protein [Synechococcaceae cyanobacterium]|nr:vitamin K epoxide reductase family protein [Synechococcaceae cyanobacterium]
MTSARLSERLGSQRRRSETSHRWVRWLMALLATIGAIDTGSVTLKHWGLIGPLVCPGGAGGGCEKVLSSAWGTVLGQPLSLLGFLAYGAVILLSLLPLLIPAEQRRQSIQLTWSLLLLLTTGMAVFSLVLMGVLILQIKAFCFFCVLSACLSVALLVLTLIGAGFEDHGQAVFRGVITAMLVAVIGVGWAASVNRPELAAGKGIPPAVVAVSKPADIALADHLSRTGAVMYTAYWCPHCHEQKEAFGKEATARLRVIECAPDGRNSQTALCKQKKIEGFPTWEIEGKLNPGVKPLTLLADLSGYRGDRNF